MDTTDKKILSLLQKDGRLSNYDLAAKIFLSPSPCHRRVKILEDEGIIKGYVALLMPEKLNLNLKVLVSVSLNTHEPEKMANFESIMSKLPEVVQCDMIAGRSEDYQLTVLVPSLESYHHFLLKKLTAVPEVKNVHSSFVLKKVIEKTELPLNHI